MTDKIEALLDKGEFRKALAAAGCAKPGADKARLLFLKGEALRGLGLFAEALAAYAAALKPVPAAGLRLEVLLARARCLRALGAEKDAVAAAGAALKLAKRLGESVPEAELEWALALRLTGRLAEAEAMLLKLLSFYRAGKDGSAAAFVLWALGGLYRLQGRFAEGIKAFEASLSAARRAGDASAAGYALFGSGGILRVAGYMGKALACYARAKKLFSETEDTFARAYAECGTSNVLRQLGRLEEAYAGYERAYNLYHSLSDWADLGFVEWGMGEINLKDGLFAAAAKNYSEAARLFKGRGEPRGEALTRLSQARLAYLAGKTAEAERLHAKALAFIKKHGLHTHLETFT